MAGGVAETLERRGVTVAGALLISGGIPFGPVVSDEMRAALFIPTRTAAALHHGRLEPALQRDPDATLARVEAWAREEYGPALVERATLSTERRAELVRDLARYTGLETGVIDADSLVVRRRQFAEELLRDRGLVLGRFDARETATPGAEPEPLDGARARTVARYLRTDLGFETDLAYQGLEVGYAPATREAPAPIGARWSYDHERAVAAMSGAASETPFRRLVYEGPPGGSDPWLRRAMALNPTLRAFVAAGLYDSLNSCPFNDHLVGRLEPELAANVTARCYVGGHMMYRDEDTRARLKRDVTEFLRGRSSSPP